MYRFLFLLFCCSSLLANQWSGVDYAQNSSVQQLHAERLLNSLALKGDERILDVGCGDGKITARLAQKVPQGMVIGIDPSESMLDKAKENQLSNLIFKQGSAEDFSCQEGFDHIIAIHVMHWIKEQERALKNMHAHLKPQGRVHFILAPSKEGLPFHTALQKTLQNWDAEFAHFTNPQQVFDLETYRKLMVKSGFHVEAIHYLYHESIHENKEKLKAWIRQWQPHAKHLAPSQQEAFLDELLDRYLNEMGSGASGSVKWGEYVLIVEGSKIQK